MESIAQPRIFCVDDDRIYQGFVENELEKNGYNDIRSFSTGKDFLNHLYMMPDIILLDYFLDEEVTGLDLLKKVKSFNPDIHVIMLSGQDKLEVAINSLKYGAYDYVIKNDAASNRIGTLMKRISRWNNIIKKNKQLKKIERSLYIGLALAVSVIITLSAV